MTNGARIVGNYTLGTLLGRGGTSEVYAATHRFLGHEVAVKMLLPQLAADHALAAAFVAEAGRTREIAHPNVVRVHDFGRDDATGSCFLVMERIAGDSLAARLKNGPLTEAALRPLAAAIADGMDAAHARGIVHRDLKPGNIMLRGGQPTIVDFGIAKSLDASSAVVTNRRVGTIAYMAPEQLTEGLITPAADVWALGVVMYEALAGRLPYDNFNDGRLPQLFDTAPRAGSLAAISPALDALIARCLDRSPAARPTMREVAATLRASAEERITEDAGPRLPIERVPVARPGVAGARRRRVWPLAVAGALIVAGLAYVAWPRHVPPHESTIVQPVAAPSEPSAAVPSEPPAGAGNNAPAAVAPAVAPSEPPAAVAAEPAPAAAAPPTASAAPARHKPARGHSAPKRKLHTTQGETLD